MRFFYTAVLVFVVLLTAVPTVSLTAAPAGAARHSTVGVSEGAIRSGQVFRDCPDCPEMAAVPAGQFMMGSPLGEPGRFDSEGPRHGVSVRAFAMSRYPVTVQEFSVFVRETGYEMGPCDWPSGTSWRSAGFAPKAPVVCVNWNDAQAYVSWLNDKQRKRTASTVGGEAGPYRLPSEAEWEYAARAGSTTARWWGEAIGTGNAVCNGCGSSWDNRQIAPVGSFAANPFGLFDMLGNVWQWTADCWNENYAGAPADGGAWRSGDCSKRVMRGGSWSNLPKFVRSAARNRDDATSRSHDYASYAGFRVVRNLP
ncbi:formylglycine-generating enzyme family protein [Telmatospirillum siberiense]|nr:formylglycine-generating enzyme family protein [Telmatospirillum siberiense]